MGFFFKFKVSDQVSFGDRKGVITMIDDSQRFGVEAEFTDPDTMKTEICYFDNSGKFKSQDDPRQLIVSTKTQI